MAFNLGAHVDGGGEVSKQFHDLVAEGRKVTATEYLAAVRDARRYADAMMGIFEQVADAIITLSARGVAPKADAGTGDPVFCSLWTLTGMPALNLPVLTGEDELPLGLSLSEHADEMSACCVARALISKLDSGRNPPNDPHNTLR